MRRARLLRLVLGVLLTLGLVAVILAIKIRVGLGPVLPTPPLLSARPVPDALLFRDVSVFTGTETTLRVHQDVLVRAGQIVAVAPAGQRAPPDDAVIVEGAGRTLLPGYIDAHTHISGSGAPPWAPARLTDLHNLEAYAYAGITTAFVLGGMADDLAALEASMARAEAIGPRLFYTHLPITAPGGHPVPVGKQLLPWPIGPVLASMVPQVSDRAGAERAVEDAAAHDVHFIKAVVDRLPPSAPVMHADALAGIVEASHRRGLKVFVHVGTIEDALLAVRAGADVLAHGIYRGTVTRAQAEELARSGVPVIFTLAGWVTTAELARGAFVPTPLDEATVPAEILDSLRGEAGRAFASEGALAEFAAALLANEAHWQENVRTLHAAGVPLLIGTDSPLPGIFPGSSFHVELALLSQAGVPNGELLRGATSRAASVLGLDTGHIEAGRPADLVLVKGDPVADIADAARIEMVLARGRILQHLR